MPRPFFYILAPGQPQFSEAVAIETFEPARPYPQNPSAIIYRTRFQQLTAYYAKPAPNTPHPNLPQVYFADDVDFRQLNGGACEFTRVYCTLPNSWNDYESYPYTYPGLQWSLLFLGRAPFAKTTTSRLTHDYYLVGTLPNFANRLLAYDDLSNAAWTKTACTATPNAAALPACAGGAVVAAKLVESASNARHFAHQGDGGSDTVASGAIFVKAAERTVAKVVLFDFNYYLNDLVVDLSTGQPISSNVANASIAAIGDGWWRIGLTANGPTNSTLLMVMPCDATGADSYAGDGSSGLYAWRGQLVNGNAIPAATVPPTVTPDTNSNSYPVLLPDLIPVKLGTQFFYAPNAFPNSNIVVEYISAASSPNYQTYYNSNTSWVNTDAANSNSYSIEATDSTLSLWQGSIWSRQRRFVKAR